MQLTRISWQFKNENAGIDVVENECSNTICCIYLSFHHNHARGEYCVVMSNHKM